MDGKGSAEPALAPSSRPQRSATHCRENTCSRNHRDLRQYCVCSFGHGRTGRPGPFPGQADATILIGVFLIAFNFLLGWPAVAALGLLSFKMQTPWLVAVGGPLTYGLSHLVFLAGMYISGGTYTLIFCRWLAASRQSAPPDADRAAGISRDTSPIGVNRTSSRFSKHQP